MPDQKKVEPSEVEVVNDEPEVDETEGQVTVDLDAPPKQPGKDTVSPKPEPSPKPLLDVSKLHNTIAFQTRKLEQAMRELQEVRTQLASRHQEPVQDSRQVQQAQDEIDELAQKDWKAGVKKVVEKDIEAKVQEILDKRERALQDVQRKSLLEAELEKSKQKVLQRYPNIEDESSEESSLYRQVVNEDGTLLSNVHGPEIAMYRMEERLRQMGRTPATVKPIVDREVNRLARAGASSVVGRQAAANGKIVITKEQKEFCDHYGIPYEQYAKNLKAQNANGGIEA